MIEPPVLQTPWATEARRALQQQARDFARDVVLPVADALDPHKGEMPTELIEQMATNGWFGITVPLEHGGLGLGVFEFCLVSEELARAWLSVGSILARGQGLGTQVHDAARKKEYWRDARLTTIFEGTSEIQRRIISDRMLPR